MPSEASLLVSRRQNATQCFPIKYVREGSEKKTCRLQKFVPFSSALTHLSAPLFSVLPVKPKSPEMEERKPLADASSI